jgi:hypothetical protein
MKLGRLAVLRITLAALVYKVKVRLRQTFLVVGASLYMDRVVKWPSQKQQFQVAAFPLASPVLWVRFGLLDGWALTRNSASSHPGSPSAHATPGGELAADF